MSRIGEKPITVPASVKVKVDGKTVAMEGPKGKLSHALPDSITAALDGAVLKVECIGPTREDKALHGLSRSLLANKILGVLQGYQKKMEIHGVGFKAAVQGKTLNLSLGFSHPIHYPIPDGIKVTVNENTQLLVEGIDKQLVGAVAADIRRYYPPEPYKGKGVRFAGEQIRRKAGKTAQSK